MNPTLSLSTSDLVELDKKIEITKVLIIYTGGTIGMKTSKQGYVPESGYLSKQLKTISSFHDPSYKLDLEHEHITPVSKYDKRANYKILELDPLLDSSNVSWKEVFL
jgi:60kDa lysophospholipase